MQSPILYTAQHSLEAQQGYVKSNLLVNSQSGLSMKTQGLTKRNSQRHVGTNKKLDNVKKVCYNVYTI